MTAEILIQNDHGKVLLTCFIFSCNEIDEIKTFDFLSKWSGFYPYEMLKFVTACFFVVWNCWESPFLEVCKLTDLMAIKMGRFTNLGAVLVEYYRAKSSNG